MADAILLPKLGQTVEEAAIVTWHKKEGDPVKKGEVLFEIETDKAVLEAESFFEGTLLKIYVQAGQTVPVSTVVAYVGAAGEKVPSAPPAPKKEVGSPKSEVGGALKAEAPAPAPAAAVASPVPVAPLPSPAAAPVALPPTPDTRHPTPAAQRQFITPRAKALCKAKVISPAPITGSGPNGRVRVKDVEAYLASVGYDGLRFSAAARKLASLEGIDILSVRPTGHGGRVTVADIQRMLDERPKPMSKMRRIIAKRLGDSFRDIPHFYVTTSVDMTDLLAYRQELKDQGTTYTVTDFILEAVILSLKEFPTVNSMAEGHTTRWRGSVELGMAVGLAEGLVVPVIRQAEDLGMAELHATARTLAAKARDGKLLPDEMTGSSFTVSNMGMFDVENFHAIVNPGEGAILAVASTKKQPVVKDDQIVIRAMMKLTLSVDHRIVDGTVGALFVNALKMKLEDVELWKSLT
jgi:pyruvate dehydrogenase E2 component (dihydrolipoamide acetyltransferase)